ncbi:MAG: Na+/H+ antiporter subunit E [Bacteroidota bacterium]
MKLKGFIVIFSLLFFSWLVLNHSLQLPIILIGVGLAGLLSFLMCTKCSVYNDIKFTPKAILYTFLYLGVFILELVKSNLDIAKRVLSPKLPINPGIVKAETVLQSQMGRLILANSITLTPGTFTIDVIGNSLYIHCVNIEGEDMEQYAQNIVRKFEKYLEVLYG